MLTIDNSFYQMTPHHDKFRFTAIVHTNMVYSFRISSVFSARVFQKKIHPNMGFSWTRRHPTNSVTAMNKQLKRPIHLKFIAAVHSFFISVLAKRLARKSVSEMTYLVSRGT